MRRSVSAVVLGMCLALLAGCVAGEESDSAAQDLTGTVTQARACKVQMAYLDAPLEAFTSVAFARLPADLKTRLTKAWGDNPFESSSTLAVPSVGKVFVLEQATGNGTTTEFYDANGEPLLVASTQGSGSWLSFRLPFAPPTSFDGGTPSSSSPLQCSYGSDAGHPYDGGYPDASRDGGAYDASSPYDASAHDASSPSYAYSDAGDAGR